MSGILKTLFVAVSKAGRSRSRRDKAVPELRLESLEPRQVLAAVYPTNLEQYMLELVNKARANPTAQAAAYGVELNEGLAADTISATPKQPLAINPSITDSARKHSQWMIDTDTFEHVGANGSTYRQRMTDAGYVFASPFTSGESIGWRGTTGPLDTTGFTTTIQKELFVDTGIAGRGHRKNILNDSFREIGVGIVTGGFEIYTNTVMVTQDFASSGTGVFLTGVAFRDSVVADRFYTPGEGLGDVTITALRTSDSATFSTTSWSSGGYSLALPAGTYDVTASGGGLGTSIVSSGVVIGTENVKQDFIPTPIIVSPTIAITSNRSALKAGQTATITFTLSEKSRTFTKADIVAAGGVLSAFTGSGRVYTAKFTPTARFTGSGVLSVAAGTFTNAAGTGNLAGAIASPITIDTAAPTIAITSNTLALKAGDTATITFTLSENSTTFTRAKVVATGGVLSDLTGSGRIYTATFTPAANSKAGGKIVVAAGAFTDEAGNGNKVAARSPKITIDTIIPRVAITSSRPVLTAGKAATITFTLSEASTTFTLDDVVAAGGVLSGFTGSGKTYRVTFTPTADSTASGTISVLAGTFTDTAGNANTAGSLAKPITIDTRALV